MAKTLIPNKPIREAFIRSGLPIKELATLCGWFRKNGEPDGTKVSRSLGISVARGRDGKQYANVRIEYNKALEIINALGLDPVDFREIGL